jgi:hypothetical protein
MEQNYFQLLFETFIFYVEYSLQNTRKIIYGSVGPHFYVKHELTGSNRSVSLNITVTWAALLIV